MKDQKPTPQKAPPWSFKILNYSLRSVAMTVKSGWFKNRPNQKPQNLHLPHQTLQYRLSITFYQKLLKPHFYQLMITIGFTYQRFSILPLWFRLTPPPPQPQRNPYKPQNQPPSTSNSRIFDFFGDSFRLTLSITYHHKRERVYWLRSIFKKVRTSTSRNRILSFVV